MYLLRYIFIICIYIGVNSIATSQYQSRQVQLISVWDQTDAPQTGGQKYNDIKAWYDSLNNREYAIIGGIDSIYFIDITIPQQPKRCDAKKGKSSNCINRDFEVYKNFCYAVADEGNSSLQIFDLKYLPDSVSIVYDKDSLSANAHTIFREGTKLYLCKNRRGNKIIPMEILDISNPKIPMFMGSLNAPIIGGQKKFDYVHDVCVMNDTAYCSCGNDGLYIYSVANPATPIYISSITQYPLSGYNHSSYKNITSPYLYFTDENNGAGMKVCNIKNIKTPDILEVVQPANGVTPHNPYIYRNKLYLSSYQEGVKIYNIDQPDQPREIGWFDTYPQNTSGDYSGLRGCWSLDASLPSGRIIASDTHNGLFVLKADSNLSVNSIISDIKVEVFPIPTSGQLYITSNLSDTVVLELYNIEGKYLKTFNPEPLLSLTDYPTGIYLLKIATSRNLFVKKIVKTDN